MKIIDKVKTIFWDNEDDVEDEEIELPIKKKDNELPKEMINERDLFKTETSFKFPVVFTEEDFAKTIPPEKPINNNLKHEYTRTGELNKRRDSSTKNEKENKKEEPVKTFRVSPAISPIYGVLDKNYKKEDIKTKDTRKSRQEANEMNFENVRKKAYGTLTDDIEKTLTDGDKLKQELEKEEIKEKINPNKNITIEEAIGNYDSNGEIYSTDNNTEEDIIKLKKDKKNILEDTIEQDLFNLIDSMYDKEGEENDGTSE